MNKLPTNEKFIIFLNPRYFKTSIFKSFYDKLKENLENKGITIYNIKTTVKELKKNMKKILINYYLMIIHTQAQILYILISLMDYIIMIIFI